MSDENYSSKDSLSCMLKIMVKQKSGLCVAHINAQSLNNKLDEFRHIFCDSGVDLICVSETWFHSSIDDGIFHVPGYKLLRADRRSHAGGVAIYIKVGLNYNLKLRSNDESNMEYLFIEITMENKANILLGCVYRPNNHIDFEPVRNAIETLSLNYNDTIIVGDFNSNLIIDNNLSNLMETLGLVPFNTSIPTHFTSTNSSLLDLVFVNNISKVLIYDQLCAPGFSKHDLLFFTYDMHVNTKPTKYTYRVIKNIDESLVSSCLDEVNWNAIYSFHNVDDQLAFLQNNIYMIYNSCVPLKTKVVNHKQQPWFNNTIKFLIEKRDIAYQRWQHFKTFELHDMFKSARRAVVKSINAAKYEYYSQKFKSAIDSKSKWKTIREIGIGTKQSTAENIDINKLNENFIKLNSSVNNSNIYSCVHTAPIENDFSFRCVDNNEVMESIFAIKSNAIGTDELCPIFIKFVLPKLLTYITYLLNSIITQSTFPRQWKLAKIIPIPKSNNDFRPIAILPFLSKVLERLLNSQISSFLEKEKLLTENQSGFRKKRSCTTTLIDVVEDLRKSQDENMTSFLVLLDHSKAFDTVNHDILLSKLRRFFYFTDTACNLISSYLSNRSQCVVLNDRKSRSLNVLRGVPQGSILGPLLFTLYINDLPHVPETCSIQMYADDVQLYASTKTVDMSTCITKINNDLKSVYEWASNNCLDLNPSKSKLIVIGKNQSLQYNVELRISDNVIQRVESSSNLGLTINTKLTWTNHINRASGKVYGMLRNLWNVRTCTTFNIRMMLAKTYLLPTLLYGCEVFAYCDYNDSRTLNVAYNNIARYVFNKTRRDRISEFAYKIFNVQFSNYLKIRCLIQLHNIIYTKEPFYLYNRVQFARSNRGKKLILPRFKKLSSERQFFINTIRLWNSLPNYLQLLSNASVFKTELFKFYA